MEKYSGTIFLVVYSILLRIPEILRIYCIKLYLYLMIDNVLQCPVILEMTKD